VLLVMAALVTKGFANLINVDAGFEAENVVAVRFGQLPPHYNYALQEELTGRVMLSVRALPGVTSVAAASSLPLERGFNFPVDIADHPELGIGDVELRFVTPGYLETLAVPLRIGRGFDDRDVEGAELVAIVNEAFARHFWQDASPVGRTIQIGHFRERWLSPGLARQTRVIGVAGDIHEMGLDRSAKPTVLVPRAQLGWGAPVVLVRAHSAGALTASLRDLVQQHEPRLAPVVEPMTAVVGRSVAAPRFRTMLLVLFAGSALIIAAIGIFGLNAAIVQQRRRELGLRIALGATPQHLAGRVLLRGLLHVAGGAAAGIIIAIASVRVIASLAYGASLTDPGVILIVVLLLTIVATASTYVPARRAAQLDPMLSLRPE
jgi:predicted permease